MQLLCICVAVISFCYKTCVKQNMVTELN